MNFERCLLLTIKNWQNLKNKKLVIIFLHYHYDLLIWKKNKLKLGAISFIIKKYKFDEVLLWEDAEIKFIRQDTTLEDERKIEVLLEKLKWEWNSKNYIALFVVVSVFLYKIYTFIWTKYRFYLPSLAFRADHYDYVLKCGFESLFSFHTVGFLFEKSKVNFWLIDLFTNFCSYFNIIF